MRRYAIVNVLPLLEKSWRHKWTYIIADDGEV